MTKFDKLRYFTKEEFGTNANKLNEDLLMHLDKLRAAVGFPLYITSAYREGDKGYHGRGLALDIVCPAWDKSYIEFYEVVKNTDFFNGIGLYANWTYKGKKVVGVHIDMRGGRFTCWLGLGNSKANASYALLNADTVRKYRLDV